MGGANELGVIAAHACGARLLWGLRSSDFRAVPQTSADRWLFRIGALLSPLASRIIVNSHDGLAFHASQGYCRERLTVVSNGIDTSAFTVLPLDRARVRHEWNVGDDILIGRPGRFDPFKDYPAFIKAAAIVGGTNPRLRFVCVGDGTDCDALRRMVADAGLSDRMIWAGGRGDMPAVYNALDICVSSSVSEGFPNIVAEAMACGTPCVVTDVGDSARIVGPTGIVVPPSDPAALARGVAQLLSSRSRYSREDVRRRIEADFSLERLVVNTESELERVLLAPLADHKGARMTVR
jgi:glycosyltransferase involved in cell wall biosynthesis